jgi:phage replication O-like protein O
MSHSCNIPNSAIEWITSEKSRLTPREGMVMMFIFRYTYGFHRDRAAISNRFIGEHMGLNASNVQRIIKSLVKKGVIESDTSKPRRTIVIKKKMYKIRGFKAESGIMVTPEGEEEEKRYHEDTGSGTITTPKIYKRRKEDAHDSDSGIHPYQNLSSLEQLFLNQIDGHNLVEDPVAQYHLSGKVFDFAFCGVKLLVEIDGGMHLPNGGHRSLEGAESDWNKALIAMDAGWTVVRFEKEDLESLDFLDCLKYLVNGERRSHDGREYSPHRYLAQEVYYRRTAFISDDSSVEGLF